MFVKLDPYIYTDTYNILQQMELICCRRDYCHNHTLSYHVKNPHILILALFHKGSFQFNIKYNFKKKEISYKLQQGSCDCVKQDIINFITKYQQYIKYYFKKDIFPILSALEENTRWDTKKYILNKYLYNDLSNIVAEYLCFFDKCAKCKKLIEGKYRMCYKCFQKQQL